MQGDVGVHLSYIRRDIDAIKKSQEEGMKDIKNDLTELKGSYVTLTVFQEHLKTDEDHEARLRVIEKESEDHALVKKVVYGAVAFILIAVLSAIVYLVVGK